MTDSRSQALLFSRRWSCRRAAGAVRRRFNRLIFAARWQLLRREPYVTRYFGFELVYGKGNLLVRRIADSREYEPSVAAYLQRSLPRQAQVIDVGANLGLFSLAVLGIEPSATVHMFEPSPIPRRYLQQTLERNDLEDRVRLNATAVSGEAGEASFLVHAAKSSACDGFRELGYAAAGDATEITVETTTLDLYVRQCKIDRVDLIKLDAEGAELFILRGAATTLKQLQPAVLFEAARHHLVAYGLEPEDFVNFFEAVDYQIETLRGSRLTETEFCAAIDTEHEFVAVPHANRKDARVV